MQFPHYPNCMILVWWPQTIYHLITTSNCDYVAKAVQLPFHLAFGLSSCSLPKTLVTQNLIQLATSRHGAWNENMVLHSYWTESNYVLLCVHLQKWGREGKMRTHGCKGECKTCQLTKRPNTECTWINMILWRKILRSPFSHIKIIT